jgi:hypothetical protein
MADDDTDLASGTLRFIENVLPSLEAGDYQINATHSVEIATHSVEIGTKRSFSSTQRFSVQAPRFRLDARDIHSLSPANNSAGKYDTQLPHIVFNKRTLPWEHELQNQKGLPWLALLILDEGDIVPPDQDKQHTPNLGMMSTLEKAVNLATSPQSDHTTATASEDGNSQLWKPTITSLSVGQNANDPVEVIQIKRDSLLNILPSQDEMRLLAHVRQVSMEHREMLPLDHTGWFSVLVANRFPCNPQTPTVQYAHVVSLEGLADFISLNNNFSTTDSALVIQLVSLYSWSFTCLPDHGESFSSFMHNLAGAGMNTNGDKLWLRLPLQSPSSSELDTQGVEIYDLLRSGYIPLPYQDGNGKATLCWYRGPAIPIKEAPFTRAIDAQNFNTAEDAMMLQSQSGLCDLTYSIAWQTGRLMALSNRAFSINLMDWRKRINHLLWLLANLDDHNLLETMGQKLLVSMQNTLVSDTFISYLLTEFKTELANSQADAKDSTPPPIMQPSSTDPQNSNSQSPADQLQELLQKQEVSEILYDMENRDALQICEFLARCSLLYDVPFERIVPDPNMLPAESIRFFYLDQAWLDSMMDGALSIGIQSTKNRLHTDNSRSLFRSIVDKLVRQYRNQLLNQQVAPEATSDAIISGFLLRSEVLTQFPGLQIKAYQSMKNGGPDEATLLTTLRFDRLSPSVLLCLYPETPVWIEFDEPHENVSFGILEDGTNHVIKLRSLTDGSILSDPNKTISIGSDLYRSLDNRVLNIKRLADLIQNNVSIASHESISSADFALQMVKVTEKLVFQVATLDS